MAKLAQTKGPSSPVLLLFFFFPQCLLVATIEDGAVQTCMTLPFNTFTASKHFQLWGFSELDVSSLLVLDGSFFHSVLMNKCNLLYHHPLPGSLQVYYLEKSRVLFFLIFGVFF